MLVLGRHIGKSLRIGDTITVKVVEVRGNIVILGIEAPREIPVHREEVYQAIQRGESRRKATELKQERQEPGSTDAANEADAA
jgi:carbon storage regulator